MNDEPGTDQLETPSPHASRIGRRLAIVREELRRLYGEADWSQRGVAQKINVTQNIISRMEQGEGGKIENWFKLMCLYEQKGYNLSWIITENNSLITKFHIEEATTQVRLVEQLLMRLDKYEAAQNTEFTELRQLLLSQARS